MATLLDPVRLSTTVNIDLSTPLQLGIDSIDGTLVYENNRILVKAQTDRKENGIYRLDSSGNLLRTTDFALGASILCGTAVFIQEGLLLKNTGWTVNLYDQSAATSLVVGTDRILFDRFSVNLKLANEDIQSALILRSTKGYPLTIGELDNNFKWISSTLIQKLNISDFTPVTITDKINSISASAASLDAWELRGYEPTEEVKTYATIAIRDAAGHLYANNFFGDLIGNADTASLADYATLANNVDGIVAVVNGGTGSSNAAGARNNLGAVNIAGDTMTGKLTLPLSNAFRASLNIPVAEQAPTVPAEGDIWTSASNIQYFLNGVSKTVAPLQSPTFTGNPAAPTAAKTSNSTALATTAYVQLHVADLNAAIALRATINSPTLTGEPKSVTPLVADVSTKIATTEFVLNKINSILPSYYTKSESNDLLSVVTSARVAGDSNLQAQVDELKQMKGIPVGTVMHYAAAVVPVGWLKCNGAILSKLAYPQLFDKIGYTYGGSGNDFRLPDLRGEFLRGWDDGRNVDANRAFGSNQLGTLVSGYDDNDAGADIGFLPSRGSKDYGSDLVNQTTIAPYGVDKILWGSATNRITYSTANAPAWLSITRPRNVAMLACIKAFGDIDDPDLINATQVLESITNKVDKRGDTMSGRLTLSADPVSGMHAATKQYVDTVASAQFTITYGNTQYSQAGFTNQVGSWNFGANWFDVYPPAGKTMANLAAFMPSIAVIHFAGGVDANDSMVCTWSNLGDRIRVYVQNTEQRSTPAANWIAFWR